MGNTVVDSHKWVVLQFSVPGSVANVNVARFVNSLPFDPRQSQFALVTGHRRENLGRGFLNVINALEHLSHEFPEFWFVLPIHPNPLIKNPIEERLVGCPNILLLPPMDYAGFIYLLMHAKFVISDSKGVQEEAPSFGKQVLVMRENTERPKAIAAGFSTLAGTSESEIIRLAGELIERQSEFGSPFTSENPFGDGQASRRIANALGER